MTDFSFVKSHNSNTDSVDQVRRMAEPLNNNGTPIDAKAIVRASIKLRNVS